MRSTEGVLPRAFVLALPLLVFACGDGESPPRDEGLTDIPAVNRVIAAVDARDPQALQAFVKYTTVDCVAEQRGVDSPPICPPGVAPGTPVNVLLAGGCHGGYLPEWEIHRLGADLEDFDLELAAVLEAETTLPGPPPHEIVYRDRTNDTALIFSVVEEGIWQTRTSCGPDQAATPYIAGKDPAAIIWSK